MPDQLNRKESSLSQVQSRYVGLVYLAGSKQALGYKANEISDLIALLSSTQFQVEKRARFTAESYWSPATSGEGCCRRVDGLIAIETGRSPKGKRVLSVRRAVCCGGSCGGQCPGDDDHDCVPYYDTNGVLDCRCDGAAPLVTTASGHKKWSRGDRQV